LYQLIAPITVFGPAWLGRPVSTFSLGHPAA